MTCGFNTAPAPAPDPDIAGAPSAGGSADDDKDEGEEEEATPLVGTITTRVSVSNSIPSSRASGSITAGVGILTPLELPTIPGFIPCRIAGGIASSDMTRSEGRVI
jgi:hypothetical protein